MKKALSIVLSLCLIFSVTACSSKKDQLNEKNPDESDLQESSLQNNTENDVQWGNSKTTFDAEASTAGFQANKLELGANSNSVLISIDMSKGQSITLAYDIETASGEAKLYLINQSGETLIAGENGKESINVEFSEGINDIEIRGSNSTSKVSISIADIKEENVIGSIDKRSS